MRCARQLIFKIACAVGREMHTAGEVSPLVKSVWKGQGEVFGGWMGGEVHRRVEMRAADGKQGLPGGQPLG